MKYYMLVEIIDIAGAPDRELNVSLFSSWNNVFALICERMSKVMRIPKDEIIEAYKDKDNKEAGEFLYALYYNFAYIERGSDYYEWNVFATELPEMDTLPEITPYVEE